MQGRSPAFTVDLVQDRSPAQDDRIARRIEGRITVPCFLTNGCQPGGQFTLDDRGLPRQRGTTTFRYFCNIPRVALDPAAAPKARAALYGHGLLGNPAEFDESNVKSMSNEHNVLLCATAWAGFSAEDVPHIITALDDLSRFNTLPDRMQQGFLQQLFLGRAPRRSCGGTPERRQRRTGTSRTGPARTRTATRATTPWRGGRSLTS